MLSVIKEKIKEKNNRMISYAEFMELALYHPKLGYYMKQREKVGRKGDFITTSNISDIYGRVLAKWFLKQTDVVEIPPAVCEIGAGNGRFASAFINGWKSQTNEPLYYYIVEESPFHRELQREIIPFDDRIKQLDKLEEIKPFSGLIFSNELFDALPVHVIEIKNGQLMEIMVSVENEQLVEKSMPLENENIRAYIQNTYITLRENQRIEIPLFMEPLVSKISHVLEKGIVVTVDYGYSDSEWMEPIHKDGSLRGYYKHEMIKDVLRYSGEMDITSHIHFDSLIRVGEKNGLRFVRKQRQDEFLLSIGILKELQDHQDPNPFSEVSRRNRAIKSLIMPSGMSSSFHAIIQEKGLNPNLSF